MSTPSTGSGAHRRTPIRTVAPLFVVADLERSVAFYRDQLGFEDPAIHGAPPCFAMLHRDGFDVMLSLAEPGSKARPNGPDGVWDVYWTVADLDAEIAALRAAGVAIDQGPRETFYRMREIEVLDPDGHRLCLAQDISNTTRAS